MSATLTATCAAPTEADLIERIRNGDVGSFSPLYDAHYRAATAFARSLTRCAADADDLVSEAFARVLKVIRDGRGPVEALRPYLFGIVKNLAKTSYRQQARVEVSDELDRPTGDEPADALIARTDGEAARQAFATLPEAWQHVLWNVEVLGIRPRHLAGIDGDAAHNVSALAHRAREGLRDAYLATSINARQRSCTGISERLGAFARNTVGVRERTRISAHVEHCAACQRAVESIDDVIEMMTRRSSELRPTG